MAVEYNFDPIAAGEDQSLLWTMQPSPTNITGWTLELSVRERFGAPVLITLISGDGLTVVSAVAGTVTCFFASAKTLDMTPGCYVYDMWRTDTGNRHRLTYGTLTLVARVTEIP